MYHTGMRRRTTGAERPGDSPGPGIWFRSTSAVCVLGRVRPCYIGHRFD
jgi:hypothetical protein